MAVSFHSFFHFFFAASSRSVVEVAAPVCSSFVGLGGGTMGLGRGAVGFTSGGRLPTLWNA